MNLKKAIIVTLLVASLAGTIPVYAEPAESTTGAQAQSGSTDNKDNTGTDRSTNDNNNNSNNTSNNANSSNTSNNTNTDGSATDPNHSSDSSQTANPNVNPVDGNYTSNASVTDPNQLIIYQNTDKIEQNGIQYTTPRKMTVKKGVTYVSLRTIAERLGYQVGFDKKTSETQLISSSKQVGFKANRSSYTANGVSYTMGGSPYIDKGVFMVPLRSLASAFDMTLVLQGNRVVLQPPVITEPEPQPEPDPNEPPVAYFTTDKLKYRMGELIRIEDQSTDDEDAIKDRKWENNQLAFFEPGIVTISLQVTDKHGLSSTYTQEIEITSEQLYNKADFDRLFTPIGSNFEILGSSVLSFMPLPYTYTTEPYTLFRASGPETVNSEGILYQDTIEGPTRFMIHHKNNLGEKAKFYVVAQNMNGTDATMNIESLGFAGPTNHPEVAGRLAAARYFESTLDGSASRNITLAPGESKILFTELSSAVVTSGNIVTLNADLSSDSPIQYTVVMVKANNDPLALLPTLPTLDPKESIVRGTFINSTRVFEYNELVGTESQRLPLTDNTTDPFQKGFDGIKLTDATNSGNYGVMYHIVLNRVAPNTLITFNPRGGLYSGAARVNENVVHIKHIGSTQNTTSVLYRTGNKEERVELWITPAAGSNLPFTFLFLPMPKEKE